MTLPLHRFVVFPLGHMNPANRLGVIMATDPTAAHEQARTHFAATQVRVMAAKTNAEASAYVERHGFKRAQQRIGVQVYKAPSADKRAKEELTISADFMCLYELKPSRRLRQQWIICDDAVIQPSV